MKSYFSIKTLEIDALKQIELSELGNYRNLKKLTINAPIKKMPPEIGNCSNLEELKLVGCEFSKFPKEFEQLTALKKLEIIDCVKLKSLPANLFLKRYLERVFVQNSAISKLPSDIADYNKVTNLVFNGCQIKKIPKEFEKFSKLVRLELNNNQLSEIPSSLGNLRKMAVLQLCNNNFTYPPIEFCSFKYFPKLIYLSYPILDRKLKAFVKRFGATKTDPSLYEIYLDILQKKEAFLKSLEPAIILGALNSKVGEIPNIILDYLLKGEGGPFNDKPLQKGSSVALLGKVSGKKTVWKKELKAIGLEGTDTITEQTTHVLVTVNTKGIEQIDQAWTWAWISEVQLRAYLDEINPPYLLEESSTGEEGSIEQVKELLESADPNNVQVAVELLKGGGFASELVHSLFVLYMFNKDKKTRKSLKDLIKQKASPELLAVLKKNWQPFYLGSFASRSEVFKVIEKVRLLLKCPEIDSCQIAYKIYNEFKPTWNLVHFSHLLDYILRYCNDMKLLEEVIRTHFVKQDRDELNIGYPFIMPFLPNIVSLKSLSYCIENRVREGKLEHFVTIPEGMERLVNLSFFALHNGYLKAIPDFMLKWNKLERLIIYLRTDSDWNSLSKLNALPNLTNLSIKTDLPDKSVIPKAVHELKHVKNLKFLLWYQQTLVLDDVKKALPNCVVE